MVSRGGRSKGCSSCRRRRVKCDETKPICNRCTKRGLECDGPKDTTWISQTIAVPASSNRRPARSVPDGLPLVAFEDDLCLAFTRKHLLRGSSVEFACDKIQWYRGADGYTHDPGMNLLRRAILSLSVTFFGSQNRQTAIKNRGYRLYGDVLQQLNSHIADGQLQTANETILTAATCMLLEIFLPTGPTNFLKHARGIEAILEVRGPPTCTTTEVAFVVNNFRAIAIIGALANGRVSIWAKPEWKNLSPLYTDHDYLTKHELWDLLADCTQATSECNRSVADGTIQQDQTLIATVRTLLQRSEALYLGWEMYNHNLEVDGMPCRDSDLHIPNYSSATTYMLCNAAHLCVLRLAHSIDPMLSYGRSRRKAATNVLRCLELKYFEKRTGDAEANTIGFFATKIAWEALGGLSSLEGRRLAHIVRASAKGSFATGAWEHGREEFDQVYPKLTEHTFQDRWNSSLWAEKQAYNSEPVVAMQQESIYVQTRLAPLKLSGSASFPTEASNGCLPPSFFRSSYAFLPASTTENILDTQSTASTSSQNGHHAYDPGPFDFTDPLLGDIF